MIKNIFFDLDRTLWDFEKNSKLVLEEIFLNLTSRKKFVFKKRYSLTNTKKSMKPYGINIELEKLKKSF